MLVFTLAAAGVTVFVMLGLFAVPAIDACRADQRGLVECIRNLIGSRFDLPMAGVSPPPALAESADDGPAPAVGETPDESPAEEHAAEDEDAEPRLAELPADVRPPELARSLGPAPKSTVGAFPDADVPNAAPRPMGAVEIPAADTADTMARDPGLSPPALPPVLAAALDAFDPALLELPLADSPDLPPDAPHGDVPPSLAPASSDAVVETDYVSAGAEPPALPCLSPPVAPPALAAALDAFDPGLLLPAAPAVPRQPEGAAVIDTPLLAEAPAAWSVELSEPGPDASAIADAPLLPDLPPALPSSDWAALAALDAEALAAPLEPADLAPDVSAVVATPRLPDLSPPVTPPALAAALDAVDPALLAPLAESPVPDPVAPPAAAIEDVTEVAATPDEPPSATLSDMLPVPMLPPTIDAVERDGSAAFVAGDGPAGALMRLYVDGLLVGESPVEAGRWLVEGEDMLALPQHLLRVEAVDPASGEVLSSAAISLELEQPAVIEAPREDLSPLAPESPPDAAVAALAAPLADLPGEEDGAPALHPASPDGDLPVVDPPALPPIRPVVPAAESASVTILGAPQAGTVLELAPLTPTVPAVVASFALSSPGTSVPRLRAVSFGDPGAGRFVSGKAIIRRGDTLWDIAHRYYGRGVRFSVIYRANRDLIARPGRIYPGQVFDLPLVYDD
ncbi:LysM peptidoglycan-binding domain-containing protein [Devosia sp.]|uniref:LysM peptidoglycan-binding domain-containing protein n=1 Tax=Devosia sp. TaxID=1871048 RepID=UPI0035B4F095